MRSSTKSLVLAGLAVMTVANPFLVGCNDSSPTEPRLVATATPTPPPGGSIAGTWTGTFNTINCGELRGQASFQQNGSTVVGGLKGTGGGVSCDWDLDFAGTLQGNTLSGSVTDYDTFVGRAGGTLSATSLQITIDNGGSLVVGQMVLHR